MTVVSSYKVRSGLTRTVPPTPGRETLPRHLLFVGVRPVPGLTQVLGLRWVYTEVPRPVSRPTSDLGDSRRSVPLVVEGHHQVILKCQVYVDCRRRVDVRGEKV